MEIANRFVDGEDAYNNKMARSPEGDGSSRQCNQRRRSRNEDGRTRRNQVAAGYDSGDEEEDENREYQGKSKHRREKTKYSDPLMTHKYRGSQQSSREVKPKFIDSI
jgi:hypothetical protein